MPDSQCTQGDFASDFGELEAFRCWLEWIGPDSVQSLEAGWS
jgi:hypothetical protein